MPSIDYFECEDCGFRWKDQGPLLFCLNDDGEIEEYILIQSAYDLDKDSPISGDIVETYCGHIELRLKTGYDIMGILRERRAKIENIKINAIVGNAVYKLISIKTIIHYYIKIKNN